ncbi:MAG: hypothetical protein GX657_16305 [Chloroflexi bacterium]|nr:hypothetical protein [Chloroflexota bacterium]
MSSNANPTGPEKGRKPVVRAQRRRPSGAPPPAGRERADAPRREGRTDDQAGLPRAGETPGSPAQQASSQAAGPAPALSRRTILVLGILILLYLFVIRPIMQQGGGEENLGLAPTGEGLAGVATAVPASPMPLATRLPAPTSAAAVAPAGPSAGTTWLVMLYEDADDKILEKDIYVDLNEAERVGSTDQVRIVAQIDRHAGGYADDGDWTSTRRYYVTRDADLDRVGSQLIADLGEQNMADGNTLVDFVVWAAQTYPADRLVLILSDHGMGWPGGWSDPAPAARGDSSSPLSAQLGNQLYLHELGAALQTIRQRLNLDRFELIGLDACLMGQIEVFSALEPHARYAVASEETEPGLGWAYAGFLQALADNPTMNGAELGRLIVDSYVRDDQRIVDEAARADLLRQGTPLGGLFGFTLPSSDQVASQMGRDITLSAVDLSALPALVESVNALCGALQGADQRPVAQARGYAQSFTNIFGQQVPPAYIDLGHFAQLLKQANTAPGAAGAADEVLAALQAAVVAERHGAGKPGATGMAIYFPNSQLYSAPVAGPASYNVIAEQFARTSLWDDFLAFHYTGRTFDASAREPAAPASGAAVAAPGKGQIAMTPVSQSGRVAAPGRPVLLSTDITAQNLGHVFLFAGYLDAQANSLNVTDMDYLESADTREVDGVYYPVWPAGEFTLEFEWEPLVYAISDGTASVPALLAPATYGAAPEDAVYTVDGKYTFASGESRLARLYFRDGVLRQVFGFTGSDAAAAPREITPQSGDSFTVLERWYDLDAQGRVIGQAAEEAGTLTFRDQMFTWQELDAAPGNYVVGFIAEDLDGNKQQVYAQVTVQ